MARTITPFTTVKALYLSRDMATRIAPALGELVGARAIELLPAFQTLFPGRAPPIEACPGSH